MNLLFSATAFLSAFLMIWLELFFAKSLLPDFGGSAFVWATCLACFQLLLLIGCLSAHGLSPQTAFVQNVVRLTTVILSVVLLPVQLHHENFSTDPSVQLIWTILRSVGLLLIVLGTTLPTLQSWVATEQADPYLLYASSNAGALAGVAAYPLVIEPYLAFSVQTIVWAVLYLGLIALIQTCFLGLRQFERAQSFECPDVVPTISALTRLQWTLFALIPASLLSGITTFTTTEISPNPHSWAVFLGLYLVTLIAPFLPSPFLIPKELEGLTFAGIVAYLFFDSVTIVDYSAPILKVNIVLFIGISWAFHSKLSRLRQPPQQLTEFYLFVAFGGCLGGLFNALVAPFVFDRLIEYPLMLAVGTLFLLDLASVDLHWLRLYPTKYLVFSKRVICFSLLVLVFHEKTFHGLSLQRVNRSLYGAYKVGQTDVSQILFHGTTIHGQQRLDPSLNKIPGTYYSLGGPVDDVLKQVSSKGNVAVVGLGVGEIATYSQLGQAWDFYELDPLIAQIAQSSFSYLSGMSAPHKVTIGDGRLQLGQSKRTYDLIVVDAFASDTIPTHLLTLDALKLFSNHLTPNGAILYNVTNGYLNLESPLGRIAAALSWSGVVKHDRRSFGNDAAVGFPSDWVVLTPNLKLATELRSGGWIDLARTGQLWTDDFSNIQSVAKGASSDGTDT